MHTCCHLFKELHADVRPVVLICHGSQQGAPNVLCRRTDTCSPLPI